jgi:hypothetical protein
MADIILTVFALAALLAGSTLVALVTVIALGGFMARRDAAFGTSMLMMGLLLHLIGLSPPGNPWPVVILVAVSHAVAAAFLWFKGRVARR